VPPLLATAWAVAGLVVGAAPSVPARFRRVAQAVGLGTAAALATALLPGAWGDAAAGWGGLTGGLLLLRAEPRSWAGVAVLAVGATLAWPAIAASGTGGAVAATAVAAVAAAAATVAAARGKGAGARRVAVVLGGVPHRNAALAALVTGYVAFRGDAAANVEHLDLWEWALGLAILAYAVARAKAPLRAAATEEPWRSRERRHRPEVRARLDPAFESWSRAARAFLDRGERRDEYEALWRSAFETLARRPETVRKALEPLTGLREELTPRVFKMPWVMRRVEEENRRRRLQAHRTLLARYRAARRTLHGQRRRA